MSQIKIGILEDDEDTRDYLVGIISGEPSFAIQFACGSIAEARAALSCGAPQLSLIDLNLPDGSGADFSIAVKQLSPDSKALILTVLGDRTSVLAALESGADGYLLKDTPPDQIIRDIKATLSGEFPISPQAARHLLNVFKESKPSVEVSDSDLLTDKERGVLECFSKGLSYRETAQALSVTQNTIQHHVKAIYRKLDVNSRNEALYEARRVGLIDD